MAPTGSGKTEAAVIPIFNILRSSAKVMGIKCLYVTPLRALNRDIFRRVISYAEAEGLKADVRHGDTPTSTRRRITDQPPDVLITTPETLAILITSRKMSLNFRHLEWVIVDEFHELLGSERGTHLALCLQRLQRLSERRLVRVGLSATIANPVEAGRVLVGTAQKCAIIKDPTPRGYEVASRYLQGNMTSVVPQIFDHCRVEEGKNVLLFANTRDEAEYITATLKAERPHANIEIHHGSLATQLREETESLLRRGSAGIFVATSSLELGIDIGSVDQVLHWGSPRQVVKLLQRVGRSRHTRDQTAKGLILTNRLDDEIESLAIIENAKAGRIESSTPHELALDVLAHHLVGLTLDNLRVAGADALRLCREAYPFRQLSIDHVDSCLRLLDEQGIVRYDGEFVKRRGPATYRFYYENVSTIPDLERYEVVDVSTKRKIGSLDEVFVGEFNDPGRLFVLRGRSWRIITVDSDKKLVHVEPVGQQLSTIPYWIGELIPVDYATAQLVGRFRRRIAFEEKFGSERLRETILRTRDKLHTIPDDKTIVSESTGAGVVLLHACFGTKINNTFATALSTLLASKLGYLVDARSDAYRILLTSKGALTATVVLDTLKSSIKFRDIVEVASAGTAPFNWRIWQAARRFGIVEKHSSYDRKAAMLIYHRHRNSPVGWEVMRELLLERFDVERAEQISLSIRSGKIRLVEAHVASFTELARPMVELGASSASTPLTLDKTVIELVKKRLLQARKRLVCMTCGDWSSLVRVEDIGEKIACPRCKSRLVTSTYPGDHHLVELVKKKREGKELTKDNEEAFKKAWRISSLIQTFGKTALLTLSAYGVGGETAARILRGVQDEDELFKRIYRAEKTYIATRGFWDD
jgi:ATP-dependent Lhr-like helicase